MSLIIRLKPSSRLVRSFSSSCVKKDEQPEKKPSEQLFDELKPKAEQFEKIVGRRRFVTNHSNKPFPLNPWFKAIPPVEDATRVAIYRQYMSNPSEWSPRKLAEKYGLSILRVEAILKLKAHEETLVKRGYILNKDLTKKMERILESSDRKHMDPEPLRLVSSVRSRPAFRIVEEDEEFSAEEAAEILLQEPFAKIQEREDALANRPFLAHKPTEDSKGEVISKDERIEDKRFVYMFADISKKTTNDVIVREKDGTLRRATKLETLFQTIPK